MKKIQTKKLRKIFLSPLLAISLMAPGMAEMGNLMTEEKFHQVIEDLEKVHAPLLAREGKTLDLIGEWDRITVNAYPESNARHLKVRVGGGLGRHPLITPDALAVIVCHELGHFLGGRPRRIFPWGGEGQSVEGQADYWAGSYCLREYLQEVSGNPIRLRAKKAFLSFSHFFWSLKPRGKRPSFLTPDPEVVEQTKQTIPSSQCRLDTLWAGFLGRERPPCWYKEAGSS